MSERVARQIGVPPRVAGYVRIHKKHVNHADWVRINMILLKSRYAEHGLARHYNRLLEENWPDIYNRANKTMFNRVRDIWHLGRVDEQIFNHLYTALELEISK